MHIKTFCKKESDLTAEDLGNCTVSTIEKSWRRRSRFGFPTRHVMLCPMPSWIAAISSVVGFYVQTQLLCNAMKKKHENAIESINHCNNLTIVEQVIINVH